MGDGISNLWHFVLCFLGPVCAGGGEAGERKLVEDNKGEENDFVGPRSLFNVTKGDILI